MRAIVTDVLQASVREFATLPPFGDYIDPAAILVVGTRGRRGMNGKRAACHFTRFRETGDRLSADGRWRFPEISVRGREIRYIVSFVLPRCLFLSREEQAEDVVHELLHVDPSFGGYASPLRHGRAFDARVREIAAAARRRGIQVPPLGQPGEVAWYRRLRPFPHPFLCGAADAVARIDESALELTALAIDPRDRMPPPPRFLYACPVCEAKYPRERPLRMASCGSCSSSYDGRFKLRIVDRSAGAR